MKIKVEIFYPRLKQLVTGAGALSVDGGTVGECLEDLVKRLPGARKLLFDNTGKLLRHVYVYVNAESAYKTALSTPIKEGDRLIIAALIVGG